MFLFRFVFVLIAHGFDYGRLHRSENGFGNELLLWLLGYCLSSNKYIHQARLILMNCSISFLPNSSMQLWCTRVKTIIFRTRSFLFILPLVWNLDLPIRYCYGRVMPKGWAVLPLHYKPWQILTMRKDCCRPLLHSGSLRKCRILPRKEYEDSGSPSNWKSKIWKISMQKSTKKIAATATVVEVEGAKGSIFRHPLQRLHQRL